MALDARGSRPPSRASGSTGTSSGSQVKRGQVAPVAPAYQPENQQLIPTKKKERVFGFGERYGECICERKKLKFPPKNSPPCECKDKDDCKCGAKGFLPHFAKRGQVCMCRSVRGAVYSVEVYRALNSRGGALWERFEAAKKGLDRNAGVELLGQRTSDQEDKEAAKEAQQPEPPKTPQETPRETPRQTPRDPAEAAQAKAAEPKATEPKAVVPKAAEPKAVVPKPAEPKAAEPKAAEPKAAEPKAAAPKAAEPKAAEPKAAAPKAAEPKAAEPKAAEPKAVVSKAAEPKAVAPKAAEPRATEPKAAEPKATEPKAVVSKAVAPKAAEPKAVPERPTTPEDDNDLVIEGSDGLSGSFNDLPGTVPPTGNGAQ